MSPVKTFRAFVFAAALIIFTGQAHAAGLEILHDFLSAGINPNANVIEGSDGTLYGTTHDGGVFNNGTVFKIAKDGTGFALVKSFGGSDGVGPYAALLEASDGKLYGTTYSGGASNGGTVFKVAKDGTGFAVIKSFDCTATDGCHTYANLLEGSDGNLYGTTYAGGASDSGTVFKIAKDGTGFALLKSFGCGDTDGCSPSAGLIESGDGILYGTTRNGGTSNAGTVFKIAKDGTGFALLKIFGASAGAFPYAGVIEGSDHYLYGTTRNGGLSTQGTVFKIAKDGTGFATLKLFSLTSVTDHGMVPGGVIEGSDGNLYGTTQIGGTANSGKVFKLAKDGTGYAVVKSFGCGATDGCFPLAGLLQGSDGKLYGTTASGGVSDSGTVFKMAKDGTGFALLGAFGCAATDGCNAYGGVIEGSDGNLYGTTLQGGAANYGTVFKIAKDGTGFALLKSFACGAADGCYPYSGLIEGSDGFLYGTTAFGGPSDNGTVFKIAKDGTGFALLKIFAGSSNGGRPYAALIEGSDDGNLYGTTFQGGPNFGGTVFKIAKDGTGFALLRSFTCGAAEGCSSYAGLIEGSDHNLYGTTNQGGANFAGTVFKIAKDGTGFATLKSFACAADGCYPRAGLIEGGDGNLYGTTYQGGASDNGTVYKIAKDGTGFATLKSFDCAADDACYLYAGLTEGDGKLYGTTLAGADLNVGGGAIFSIGTDGSDFTVVNSFTCPDGCYLQAGVIGATDGKLYGTTGIGGDFGAGVIYRFTVGNQSQTINVTQNAPASAVFNATFDVAATGGGSGNPVVIAASDACSGGGNNSATITMTTGTGTCTVTFDQAGSVGFDAATQVTQTTTATKATPSITWNNPADIYWGATLGGTQLNATSGVSGTFSYDPAAGTLLAVGNGQTLSTTFTPTSAGNYNTAGTTVSINVLPPNTTLTSFPASNSNSANASFSFTSTKSGGPFECSLDGAVFSACTSPRSYTGLTEGSHTFQVRATDGLGHPDPTPASYTWAVDLTKPNTAITSGPANATSSTTAQFGFSATEAATFQCNLDNAAWVSCATGIIYSGLAEGSHNFQVRAVDLAGNIDPSPANRAWTVDLTSPDTTITSMPGNLSSGKKVQFKFSSSETNSTFQCSLDTPAFVACGSPQSYNGLTPGAHTFQVRAIDAAGNVDASPASYTWMVK